MRRLGISCIALILLVMLFLLMPLHYWQSQINAVLAGSGLQVQKTEGHFWRGQADVYFSSIKQNVSLTWHFSPFIVPIHFQLKQEGLFAEGIIEPSMDHITIQLGRSNMSSDFVSTALQKKAIHITGDDIVVDSLYIHWPYIEKLPTEIKGWGDWTGGFVNYPFGRHNRTVNVDFVSFELDTKKSDNQQIEPYFALHSKGGSMYLEVQLMQNGVAVATIMPAFLRALGIPLKRRDEAIPAFVMTEQLF